VGEIKTTSKLLLIRREIIRRESLRKRGSKGMGQTEVKPNKAENRRVQMGMVGNLGIRTVAERRREKEGRNSNRSL
jgi:hypothetical protein